MDEWLKHPAAYARATKRIEDLDGCAKRGDVGEICDYLPWDDADGFVVVDFEATGPTLCWPSEIAPA